MCADLFKEYTEDIEEERYSLEKLKKTELVCNTNSFMQWPKSYKNSKLQIVFKYLAFAYDLLYSYRGFYSRKYEHDFYARKNYLNHVASKVKKLTYGQIILIL